VLILAGTIGSTELATHTVISLIANLALCIGLGFMVAICTRIGNILPLSVPKAKSICLWGSIYAFAAIATVNILVYILRAQILNMFTDDQNIIADCNNAWLDMFIFQLNFQLFYINTGIATSLGMQWTVGVLVVLFQFGFGLPTIYYYAIIDGGGVLAIWRWMWPPFLIINVILTIKFVRADWDQIAMFIRLREGMF
jgi:multidrug resistance protein, MATE family